MPHLDAAPAVFSAHEIAAIIGQKLASADFSVDGFSTDTRTIEAGNCFIALKGESFNGNLYAKTAVEKGAVLCILTEQPQEDIGAPFLLVEDAVKTYGMLANAYIARLKANGAKIVAVTGSSGKTTVKNMTAHVLAKKFRTYSTQGNHNNHIGLPFTILHTPADTQILVLEMGMNHKGEISNLTKIGCPDLAVITNIGKAHIGNLGSQENIFRAKLEIVEGMDAQNGRLVLPADDEFLANTEKIPFTAENVLYSSRDPQGNSKAVLCADNIAEGSDNLRFCVHFDGASAEVLLPMTGVHNVTDALLAMHAGLTCGMSLAECAEALADFVPTALRSDREQHGNVTIIRDFYNANPEAMICSLNGLKLAANGAKMTALLGNMNELGDHAPQAHKAIGAYCKEQGVQALFCGVNFRDFAEGFGDASAAFETQAELIAELPKLFPVNEPTFVLIKASRGLAMEHVYDALAEILK